MLQASEVVDLVIAVVLLPIIITSSRNPTLSRRGLLLFSYSCIVAGYVFTIAEGFFWFDVMNVLEHASYSAAGVTAVFALLVDSPRFAKWGSR